MNEVITKDAEVQFDCFFSMMGMYLLYLFLIVTLTCLFYLTDNLQNAYVAGQELFVIQGDHYQSFHWNECGLQLCCPKGALSSSDERCEVAI